MELLYLLAVLVGFGLLKVLYDRYASEPEGRGPESELANRLFELQGEWFVDPALTPVIEQLADDLTDGDTDPIEQELAALFFAATTVAIALTDWSVDEQRSLAQRVSRLYAAVMAPGTEQSVDEWAEYLQGRAAHYERTAPVGRASNSDDHRNLGNEFLNGLEKDPRVEDEVGHAAADETLEAIGRGFVGCVNGAHELLAEYEG